MKTRRMAGVAASILAGSLVLAACGSSDTSDDNTAAEGGTDVVTVSGTEPGYILTPGMTNEVEGGKVIDLLYSGLVYYDADGAAHNEIAESIETDDQQNYTIKLQDGWKFSDGSPVTAESFVDSWNYVALLSNAQNNSYFFESIEGFSYDVDAELTGLQVVDNLTFTVKLTQPESDFPLRLGYSAFRPLPEVAFENMEAFGENPIGSGPYKLAGEGAWEHNVEVALVPNEEYDGPRAPKNGGVTMRMYETEDAAYNDLLSGNLDVIDRIPASALTAFETELGDRAVNQPAAIIQVLTIPEYLPEYQGEAGLLRRQAISHAIDREQITETIFSGSRTPARDFSSPTIDGWSDSIPGSEVLEYDPAKAEELWAQADAIDPWPEGKVLEISSNSDSDHQPWIDAVSNSIRNTLKIEAQFKGYPQFSEFLAARDGQEITGPFRAGWQGDYPGLANFLAPLYTEGAQSNDGFYSSPEFEQAIKEGNAAPTVEEANVKYQAAQEVLFRDLPGIPLWYQNTVGGSAETVDNVEFAWNSVPLLHNVTKE